MNDSSNTPAVFNFDSHEVRIVTLDGEPWFVGKDVAEVLGYTNSNKAMSDHCKGVTKRYPLPTPGGMQETRIISEPDMFRLVVNSKLPEAERFERWVFEEVLPAIRKTGQYEVGALSGPAVTGQAIDAFKIVPIVIRAARALGLDKNAAAISANQAVRQMTGTDVLAILGRTHLEAENQEHLFFTPTELGNRMGISGTAFNKHLQIAGLQTKENDQWIPSSRATGLYRVLDTGKRHGSGAMIQQIKWSDAVLSRI